MIVLSTEGKLKLIWEFENGGGGEKKERKKADRCQKFDPNNLQKQNQNYYYAWAERIKKKAFLNTDEVLLKWLKQDRNDKVPVSSPLSMIIFVLPNFYI